MGTLSGIEASVYLGIELIANMASWEFTDETEALEAGVFGNVFTTVHGMSLRKVEGNIKGFLDILDTDGQEALKTAYEGRTIITDFQLRIDDETLYTYYTSDDTITGHGVYITSLNVSAAQAEIIPVSFDFIVTGGWVRKTQTP